MINSLQINGYRGFKRFEMNNIGRLNLLVGRNNSGKTSVLEALNLLGSTNAPVVLWQFLNRRGERLIPEQGQQRPQPELQVSHLFTGHNIHPGDSFAQFTIAARDQDIERRLAVSVVELSAKEQADLFAQPPDAISSRLGLRFEGEAGQASQTLMLTSEAAMTPLSLNARPFPRDSTDKAPSLFISTESLDGGSLVRLWDKITLTPDENLVLRALQFLDPEIERVAPQAAQIAYWGQVARGGFVVKVQGSDQPIPIGSTGEGMWRMLAMAIAITQCKGGLFLVDEIDTGLYYTAMADMWKLIFNAAKEFNVQVFATTHSYDCIHSLACICGNGSEKDRVTIQRVESGKSKAVPYNEREIRVAAERQLEVR